MVICTRDRPVQLSAALHALRAALRPGDEAVVVDSASTTAEPARVATALGFPVVRCELPGLSRARNAGLRATTRPVVAFTDDDCLVQRDWLEAFDRAFQDTALSLVTGPVLLPDGADAAVHTSTRTGRRALRFDAPVYPGRVGHGANMAYRREALGRLGGFDEQLGAGARFRAGEDWDVFWRLLRAGGSALYLPEAVVTHEQWRSPQQGVATKYGYALGAGALAVKALRLGDPMGLQLLRRRLLREGLLGALKGLLRGRRWQVAQSAAAFAGCLTGMWRARAAQLENDHFLPAGGAAL